jgi:hypothetical protein
VAHRGEVVGQFLDAPPRLQRDFQVTAIRIVLFKTIFEALSRPIITANGFLIW